MPVYPIGFSIHKSKVVDSIPKKTKLLASLIPGDLRTYTFKSQDDFYDDYKKSFFGLTFKKAGWDAMRHYEILACGSIPLFANILECPTNTMTLYPKDLINQSNEIYYDILHNPEFNNTLANQDKCYQFIEQYLNYTREHLTNDKMVEYMFKQTGHVNIKKILLLSGNLDADYLRCNVLTGLKDLYGSDCHDYPKVRHIYTDFPDSEVSALYGRGFTYSQLVEPNTRNDKYDTTIMDDIKNHVYDIVIYGSYHRGIPLWNEINSTYKPNEIILICGEDIHHCNYEKYNNLGHHIFVREL